MFSVRVPFKADRTFLRECLKLRYQAASKPLKKADVALRRALKYPERGRFWVVERDGESIGYAWVRCVWTGTETAQLADLYGLEQAEGIESIVTELAGYYRSLGYTFIANLRR
ncbi:hypothetical protein [Leptolyngbya sp. FACHB-261]|uniref:hypothetical protein n=1 Tax=Leptolyngbya sp. FACHB-261 TaxID=2692806 RepID=UPI001681DBE3|nr:hypothetical protein [Leptolyngbya sp. FACHB-261]MBD2105019.1 hypothetical protein [Leptolyngbya sp. FACHB-261]